MLLKSLHTVRRDIFASNVYDGNMQTIDWSVIVGFDWNEGNRRKSVDKHGVSQAEAEQVFFNAPLLIVPDAAHSGLEQRPHALGRTDAGRLLHITFTLRAAESLIRVISARPMHDKERVRYDEEAQAGPALR